MSKYKKDNGKEANIKKKHTFGNPIFRVRIWGQPIFFGTICLPV